MTWKPTLLSIRHVPTYYLCWYIVGKKLCTISLGFMLGGSNHVHLLNGVIPRSCLRSRGRVVWWTEAAPRANRDHPTYTNAFPSSPSIAVWILSSSMMPTDSDVEISLRNQSKASIVIPCKCITIEILYFLWYKTTFRPWHKKLISFASKVLHYFIFWITVKIFSS